MVNGLHGDGKKHSHFVQPPWTTASDEWQRLDQRLAEDHLARRIARGVESLDLAGLFDSYLGVGKKAQPPELLLKVVLYEMQSKRPSPAEWARDVRENEPLRWLVFGIEPSRRCLYDFRDRIAPFPGDWHAQILQQAVEHEMTTASRAALDGSTVAADASRRLLLNEERLKKRRQAIKERLQQQARGVAPTDPPPHWMAKSESGLREQKERYDRADEVMQQRQQENRQRRSSKRKSPEKVVVSPADPEAYVGRDKDNVFRPLYNVQILRDLSSPLVLSYDVFAQKNDYGTLERMVERAFDAVGHKPSTLLVDAGYVSIRELEICEQAGIQLYAPVRENDFSAANGRKAGSNQHTKIAKTEFVWLSDEEVYQCPEGHRMSYAKTTKQQRSDYEVTLNLYACPPEHCTSCSRRQACTSTPEKGRSVSRIENEELPDRLRERMQAPAAKDLYKLRRQTVELNYADVKEHRGLRKFRCRTPARAKAQVGAVVLAHNLLAVVDHQRSTSAGRGATKGQKETPQTACFA